MLRQSTFDRVLTIPAIAMRVASRIASGTVYLLLDRFTTNAVAPLASPRTCEPGPGTLIAAQAATLNISGSKLTIAVDASLTNKGVVAQTAIAHAAGRVLVAALVQTATRIDMGWGASVGDNAGSLWTSNGAIRIPVVGAITGAPTGDDTYYIIRRASGGWFFIKGTTLAWIANEINTTSLKPWVGCQAASSSGTCDDFRVTDLPAPWTTDYGIASFRVATPSAITPTLGSNLITNGDFASWTGDNPNSWTMIAAEDANNFVTQAGPTGQAQIVSNNTVGIGINQSILSVGTWYSVTTDVMAAVLGGLTLFIGNGNFFASAYASTGTKTHTGRAPGALLQVSRTAACNVTVDNMSAKAITLASAFGNVNTGPVDYLAEVAPTLTAGTQAGMVLNLDSSGSPANFLLAYHHGTNAKLDKCVAGTYTSVISAAATYSAGARLVVSKENSSVALYYNNAKVGSTSTVSDVGIVNNTLHGAFSTYSGNTFSNLVVWPRTLSGTALSTLASV